MAQPSRRGGEVTIDVARFALTGEGALRDEQAERAALKAQWQELREQLAAREAELAALRAQPTVPEGPEKKGR